MSETYQYSVKLINPLRKSTYDVQKFHVSMKFRNVSVLKEELVHSFPDRLIKTPDQVGYIQPGHGMRGSSQVTKIQMTCIVNTLGKKK